jgi:TAP C-terminal domain
MHSLRVSGAPFSQSLISFLERKASPRQGPALKISKYTQLSDSSVIIEVSAPQRFLHLNGFTFAGSHVLQITEDADSSQTYNTSQGPDQRSGGLFGRVMRPQPTSQPKPNARQQSAPQSSQFSQSSRSSQVSHIPKGPARFDDPSGIAENFIRAFFPLYDNNRELAVKQFYDDHSQFSLSITMRGANKQGKPLDWSGYIKHSRNLTRIQRPNARAARIFKGQQAIYTEWAQLPKTIHPTFEADQLVEWFIECKQATKIPDLTGMSPTGVNGLLITTHGAIQDLSKDGKVSQRSFDRTFILGPGAGVGGIRVVSDTLILRPYSGPLAPNPHTITNTSTVPNISTTANISTITNTNGTAQTTVHPEVPPGSGIGEPRPGKSEEQLLKEQKVLALSFETRLKLQWAEQCLSGNNWDMTAAISNLQRLVSTNQIPAEAFLDGTALLNYTNPNINAVGAMATSGG